MVRRIDAHKLYMKMRRIISGGAFAMVIPAGALLATITLQHGCEQETHLLLFLGVLLSVSSAIMDKIRCVEKAFIGTKRKQDSERMQNELHQKLVNIGAVVHEILREDLAGEENGYLPKMNLMKEIVMACERSSARCIAFRSQHEHRPIQPDRDCENELNASPCSPSKSMPRNLTFAILDDSVVVRKNLLRLCRVNFSSSDKSFTRGSTPQECLSFVNEVSEHQVDYVILDENLDFDGQELSGSAIARAIRQRGFKGCIVRHSAMSSGELDPAFDYCLNKQISSSAICSGLNKAWYLHPKNLCKHEIAKQT